MLSVDSQHKSLYPPRLAVHVARLLRVLADRLDPFGSGNLDKISAAGDAAMKRLDQDMDYRAKEI